MPKALTKWSVLMDLNSFKLNIFKDYKHSPIKGTKQVELFLMVSSR